MQGLGDLPEGEFASSASAVSGDGATIVGQASSAAGAEAFIWTRDKGLQRLADLSDDAGRPGLAADRGPSTSPTTERSSSAPA